MIVEDEPVFEDDGSYDACMVCDEFGESSQLMYCHSCEQLSHVFCAGLDEAHGIVRGAYKPLLYLKPRLGAPALAALLHTLVDAAGSHVASVAALMSGLVSGRVFGTGCISTLNFLLRKTRSPRRALRYRGAKTKSGSVASSSLGKWARARASELPLTTSTHTA
jgi:hypothetical protein